MFWRNLVKSLVGCTLSLLKLDDFPIKDAVNDRNFIFIHIATRALKAEPGFL